jgi:hypothetical protein
VTEAEWLACDEPETLLERSGFGNSARKSRLLAVACCRRIWDQFVDDRSRRAVEVAERYADGVATDSELIGAQIEAMQVIAELVPLVGNPGVRIEDAADTASDADPFRAASAVPWMSSMGRRTENARLGRGPQHSYTPIAIERRNGLSALFRGKWKISLLHEPVSTGVDGTVLCGLIRDVFGNPFRSVIFSPEWRTDTTLSLTLQMYDTREFSAMPILADALQDAGCDNADILDHCRGPGPHVRGCWVVDLVLGKG